LQVSEKKVRRLEANALATLAEADELTPAA
jgi:hypothetical protein